MWHSYYNTGLHSYNGLTYVRMCYLSCDDSHRCSILRRIYQHPLRHTWCIGYDMLKRTVRWRQMHWMFIVICVGYKTISQNSQVDRQFSHSIEVISQSPDMFGVVRSQCKIRTVAGQCVAKFVNLAYRIIRLTLVNAVNLPEHDVPTRIYPDEQVVHCPVTVQESQFEAHAENGGNWGYLMHTENVWTAVVFTFMTHNACSLRRANRCFRKVCSAVLFLRH